MSTQNPNPSMDHWRKCTTCKKLIQFGQKYWVCSVSTCNRVRTDLVFCDLRCFDAHVPVMNHRDAGAFEKTAPTAKAFQEEKLRQAEPKTSQAASLEEGEILVVVSKVKNYIRERSGMNTSDAVMDVLSERVRQFADLAIENANRNNRKTVMDRDI